MESIDLAPQIGNISDINITQCSNTSVTIKNKQLGASGKLGKRTRMVVSTDGDRCTATSLHLANMINGTSFNVDQLPHFKQMLCVDSNSYQSQNLQISNGSRGLKTPIDAVQQQEENEASGDNFTCLEVFPIRCKTTNADLFRNKLGSGARGRCIKFKEQWFTPSEFEHFCGRGSSKDWKRSIKYGGQSLQSLIDDGVLTPHATNCSCYICCDDVSGSGPIRLFTPYKRRKRNQTDEESNDIKKRPAELCMKQNDDAPRNLPANGNLWDSTNAVVSPDLGTQNSLGVHFNPQVLKNLETIYSTMVKATHDFKRIIIDIQDSYNKTFELLSKEKNAMLSNSKAQSNDSEQVSGPLMSNELLSTKKCANCNREALAECSLCRRTPYCSTFCQRKDWNSHQVECGRNHIESAEQIMLLVNDQT